jgi:hypothetical protein
MLEPGTMTDESLRHPDAEGRVADACIAALACLRTSARPSRAMAAAAAILVDHDAADEVIDVTDEMLDSDDADAIPVTVDVDDPSGALAPRPFARSIDDIAPAPPAPFVAPFLRERETAPADRRWRRRLTSLALAAFAAGACVVATKRLRVVEPVTAAVEVPAAAASAPESEQVSVPPLRVADVPPVHAPAPAVRPSAGGPPSPAPIPAKATAPVVATRPPPHPRPTAPAAVPARQAAKAPSPRPAALDLLPDGSVALGGS